jgi:hypothetical protein
MKMLRTFGDSHALHAWQDMDLPGWQIEIEHLGPRLLHTFITSTWHHPAPCDAIVYSFGEIDCRVWAYQYGVEGLGNDYVRRVLEHAPARSIPVIMGVVPPEREPQPVHHGTPEQRRGYVEDLNLNIELWTQHTGVRFLDTSALYADDEGFFDPKWAPYRGHITDPGPLKVALKELLGEDA